MRLVTESRRSSPVLLIRQRQSGTRLRRVGGRSAYGLGPPPGPDPSGPAPGLRPGALRKLHGELKGRWAGDYWNTFPSDALGDSHVRDGRAGVVGLYTHCEEAALV